MDEIVLSRPETYKVGDRVLFTSGPSRLRPGIVESLYKKGQNLYTVMYRFYLPSQRLLSGIRPEPKIVVCNPTQLVLVHDVDLNRDEFLALTPPEVFARYLKER